MKTKELKQELQNEVNKIVLPDLTEEILTKYNTFKPTEVIKSEKKKRKFIYYLVPSLSLVVGAILLIIIFTLPNRKIPINNVNLISASKEVIGKEVLLAGSILDESITSSTKNMALVKRNENINKLKEDIYLIHEYLITAEMLINKEDVEMAVYNNENPDYSEYKYDMLLDYKTTTYHFYYNESGLYYDHDDLDEVSIYFDGVLVFDNVSYLVKGSRENEENEEFTTKTTIYNGDKKILTVEQELEMDENEYTYIYYDEYGRKDRIIEQSVEYDDLVKEMEISIESGDGEIEQEFSFEYLEKYIKTEYEYEYGEYERELELRIYDYDTFYRYVLVDSEIDHIDINK